MFSLLALMSNTPELNRTDCRHRLNRTQRKSGDMGRRGTLGTRVPNVGEPVYTPWENAMDALAL